MPRPKDTDTLLIPLGVAKLAIVCCGALPVLAGAFVLRRLPQS